MDNLTHTLTGLMLSRAGLNRFTPRANLILMLAANAPDLDAVTWFSGPAKYLDVHRGLTHSWALIPVMAVAAAAAGRWAFGRARRSTGTGQEDAAVWSWWKAILVALAGAASHLLLDWTNTYGIRFGLPFESSWHRLDILFIIDPWIWMTLLFGVVAPFLSRLVSGEIGAKRTPGSGAAWFALVVLSAYIGGRYLLHEQAIGILNTRMYAGQNPRRVAAFPVFGSPFRWRAVAELSDGYWITQVNLLEDFDPGAGREFFHPAQQEAIDRAKQADDFRSFLSFNQFPLWRVIPLTEPEGASQVDLYDLRFGDPSSPGFVATAVIEGNRPSRESLRFGAPKI